MNCLNDFTAWWRHLFSFKRCVWVSSHDSAALVIWQMKLLLWHDFHASPYFQPGCSFRGHKNFFIIFARLIRLCYPQWRLATETPHRVDYRLARLLSGQHSDQTRLSDQRDFQFCPGKCRYTPTDVAFFRFFRPAAIPSCRHSSHFKYCAIYLRWSAHQHFRSHFCRKRCIRLKRSWAPSDSSGSPSVARRGRRSDVRGGLRRKRRRSKGRKTRN